MEEPISQSLDQEDTSTYKSTQSSRKSLRPQKHCCGGGPAGAPPHDAASGIFHGRANERSQQQRQASNSAAMMTRDKGLTHRLHAQQPPERVPDDRRRHLQRAGQPSLFEAFLACRTAIQVRDLRRIGRRRVPCERGCVQKRTVDGYCRWVAGYREADALYMMNEIKSTTILLPSPPRWRRHPRKLSPQRLPLPRRPSNFSPDRAAHMHGSWSGNGATVKNTFD